MGCGDVYDAYRCATDPEEDNYAVYMQKDETRKAVHVGDRPFGQQSGDVFTSMREDFMQYGQDKVEYLLDRYPVTYKTMDPLCRPKDMTGSDYYFHTSCPYVRSHF